jgi:hypothetical protein
LAHSLRITFLEFPFDLCLTVFVKKLHKFLAMALGQMKAFPGLVRRRVSAPPQESFKEQPALSKVILEATGLNLFMLGLMRRGPDRVINLRLEDRDSGI